MPITCDIGRAERDDALARFRRGALRALVSARVLNEGLDVPDADVAVVVGGALGEREHVQRVGRLLRPGDGKRALVLRARLPADERGRTVAKEAREPCSPRCSSRVASKATGSCPTSSGNTTTRGYAPSSRSANDTWGGRSGSWPNGCASRCRWRARRESGGSRSTCSSSSRGPSAALDLSGSFALFRRTLVYGRALGEIVPLLAWCRRFRLRADCTLGERRATVELASGDPIFPAAEPRRYDSRLEERFAREFRKAAPDWDLVREPEAVRADGCLVFPDFALQHRLDPARRWLLEIAGFWTPEYVVRKLARYRAARLANLILCLDEARNCAEADLPPDARVIRFHRRVDPAAVLDVIERPPA